MSTRKISRRVFLKGAGVAAAALAVPGCERGAQQAASEGGTYLFFNALDAGFIEPAVARLIPADDTGPGALEAGVPFFIDRQLAGAWGAGAGLYRSGPWRSGAPEQGYQLPFTPAELFRHALKAINDELGDGGFRKLDAQEQDAYLKTLEEGQKNLGEVPADIFFESLLEVTIEGFFADPAYGGNRDMIGWRLVGFPGAYANYYEFVDQYGIAFNRPPMSFAQDASGTVHVQPAALPPTGK